MRLLSLVTAATATTILTFGATGALAQSFRSIGTGGAAGVYYQLGGALAEVFNRAVPGVSVNAEVTGGSVDNLKLLSGDASYLALASADVAADALAGRGAFDAQAPVMALAVLYPNQVQVVASSSAGIETIADFKGKRVSTGAVGSGIEVTSIRLIEAAGLDANGDVSREALNVGDSAMALKDGKIDAMVFVGGAPASAITDIGVSSGNATRLIGLGDVVPALLEAYPGIYSQGVIAGGTYPQAAGDTIVPNVWNLLLVNADMPEDEAYALTKAVFEGKDALAAVTPAARQIDAALQTTDNSPVPFHPGALRYFAEAGAR
ncbi:MAG: TAXI family TRAP transporter solute-binding subunit [Devosia sp.]